MHVHHMSLTGAPSSGGKKNNWQPYCRCHLLAVPDRRWWRPCAWRGRGAPRNHCWGAHPGAWSSSHRWACRPAACQPCTQLASWWPVEESEKLRSVLLWGVEDFNMFNICSAGGFVREEDPFCPIFFCGGNFNVNSRCSPSMRQSTHFKFDFNIQHSCFHGFTETETVWLDTPNVIVCLVIASVTAKTNHSVLFNTCSCCWKCNQIDSWPLEDSPRKTPSRYCLHQISFYASKYLIIVTVVFWVLSAVPMCCWYPKKPGGQHSKRRDEGRLGRRRLVVHTDPKIVPDL